MASELLSQIDRMVEADVPIAEDVAEKINQFVEEVSSRTSQDASMGGNAYATVCKSWAQCCYSGVINVISPGPGVPECRDAVLRALYVITFGNPDIIDDLGWQILSQAIEKTACSEECHILALRVIRNVCTSSASNREAFITRLDLLEPLLILIIRETPSCELVQEWCAAARAVLSSDDSGSENNQSSERRRAIYKTKVLPVVAGLLGQAEYQDDAAALNAMVVFLGTMAVNEDDCVEIESGNVLPGIASVFKMHYQNKVLIRNTISLLRYLCIDPTVRRKCSVFTFMSQVLYAANSFSGNRNIIEVVMSCCAMLTLENACQTNQFISGNGLPLLFVTLSDYSNDMVVLKAALFTLRNVCENCDAEGKMRIKELDFPSFLSVLLSSSSDDISDYYVQPILRELAEEDAITIVDESTSTTHAGTGTTTTTTTKSTTTTKGTTSTTSQSPKSRIFGETVVSKVF